MSGWTHLAQSLHNLPDRLRAMRSVGVERTLIKVARRTGMLDTPAMARRDLVADPGFRRPERMREFLARYEAVAATLGAAWTPLDFAGKRVLEVGCGPLGGWGPLAVFCGARGYRGVDPAWRDDVFWHTSVLPRLLAGVHADLSANMPAATDAPALDAFVAAVRARCSFFPGRIEDLAEAEPFDIVMSNSALEHIPAFESFATALAAVCGPATAHLHMVNFSNHRSKAEPFAKLYELSRADYTRTFGPHINLLRYPDMIRIFAAQGIALSFLPVDDDPRRLDGLAIEPSWRACYAPEILAVRTGLLLRSPA